MASSFDKSPGFQAHKEDIEQKAALARLGDQADDLVRAVERVELAATNCDLYGLLHAISSAAHHQSRLVWETNPFVAKGDTGDVQKRRDGHLADQWAEDSLANALRRLKCGEEYADASLSYGDIPAGL